MYSSTYSRVFTRIIVLLTLVFPTAAFAWGPDGHRIVALIATSRLTPEAAAQVKELLGNATLADIASWADEIRNDRPQTAAWHYVDIPTSQPSFDEKRDGNGGDNVVDAIEYYEKYVGDKHNAANYRAEALKFLVHFVGDVHQPLHASERDHDRGGNSRLVFFLDQPRAVNLHSVWDSSILLHQMDTTSVTVFASSLNLRISAAQATEWAKGTAEDWANESHMVAVKVVYPDVAADGPPPKLGEEYVKQGEQAIDQQLERAGVRLAWALNEALK
jgi:hypothetical protein